MLESLRNDLKAQMLHYRNLYNLIHTDDFEIAFNEATKDERLAIKDAISKGNKTAIMGFIDDKLTKLTAFELMSIRKLRL